MLNATVFRDILSELKEIRRILHEAFEADKRCEKDDTVVTVTNPDVVWEKVEPYNPLKDKTKEELESGSICQTPSEPKVEPGYVSHAKCPHGRSSSHGCEYLGHCGVCGAICYPTYPPQYDHCPFCT